LIGGALAGAAASRQRGDSAQQKRETDDFDTTIHDFLVHIHSSFGPAWLTDGWSCDQPGSARPVPA
jgi:hypothetical protein